MSRKRKQKFVEGEAPRSPLRARTERQAELISAIFTNEMVVTTGYPGTGKTYVPTIMAADFYREGVAFGGVDKIILTRPNVASGRSLGYRPGDLNEKLAEWFAEIMNLLRERLGHGMVEVGLKHGSIEMVPFESMRGRTFDNAFILLDEAQNTTPHEMKMFTTRLGSNVRCVVNGDIRQSDLKTDSGLKVLVNLIREYELNVPIIEFGSSDIVRGDLCREFILAFSDWECSQ